MAARLRSGATDSDTTATAAASIYQTYQKIYATDPNTSSAWTTTALDASEVGMLESIAGNRLTAAFIIVDWLPPAPAPLPGVAHIIDAPNWQIYMDET